jgi:hypothetical protein
MKSTNIIAIFFAAIVVATISFFYFSEAKADPCNGPCVKKVVECPKGGSKCSGSGNQCGQNTACKGGIQ